MPGAPKPPPPLAGDAHKGDAGRVLCVCGSDTMPGAALLVVRAAERAGAGLVTLTAFTPAAIVATAPFAPETLFLDLSHSKDLFVGRLPREIAAHDHDVRVAGPGLGTSGRARELVHRMIDDGFAGPLVLDADALNHLGALPERCREHRGALVVTPHPGEARRLLGEDVPRTREGRIAAARELARRTGGVCVLKGAGTVVTDGERVRVNETGNPGMATGGTGDVLAGILAAYLVPCTWDPRPDWEPFDAAAAAVHVHGLAGDLAAEERGRRGLVASDLIEHLPAAQRRFEGEGR